MNLFILINFFTFLYIAASDRVPAVPLVVKSPYLSTWITSPTKNLFGDWPRFWTGGSVKAMAGMIKVDGKTYEYMGHPTQADIGTKLQVIQKGLRITPTQSIFTLEAGPVELTVNFFTPIDPTDLKLLSLPGSYISLNAKSTDKAKHKVEVYFDISAEWAGGDSKEIATWQFHNNLSGGKLFNFDIQLKNQKPLTEFADEANWGTVKFFTDSGVTYQSGDDLHVRTEFVKNGKLTNTIDNNFRPINQGYPVFAYVHDLGTVDDQNHAQVFYGIAHVRSPAISHAKGVAHQLWESYFKADSNAMVSFLFDDRMKALDRANALDTKIINDAKAHGGDSYVQIVSAALRQAFGGTELVGTPENPWLMLKEISSDGNCQTVDVIYPHFPVLYYLNPTLIKLELEPLLVNQEAGLFPHKYSMHDVGSNYPRCIGHPDGKEEAMEVEESANMILMAAAYFKATKDASYVKKHYKILKQWNQFLIDHGLITGNALTTDDFLGPMKNSTNLSIKAIIALEAMSIMATAAEEGADSKQFSNIAHDYVNKWQGFGQDKAKNHFKASYNDDNSWFLLYNFYADKLLATNLIPAQVYKEQDEWYLANAKKYGVQLTSTKSFTKNDWEMFYAAASDSPKLKQVLYDTTAAWLRETKSDAPFSDWVDINTGNSPGFRNRPVIGGVFAPLTIHKP